MSHFKVAVFHREQDDVDDMMDRYSCNVRPFAPNAQRYKDTDEWYNPNAKYDYYCIGEQFAEDLKPAKGHSKDEISAEATPVRAIDFTPDEGRRAELMEAWGRWFDPKDPSEPGFWSKKYYMNRYGSKENYAWQNSKFNAFAFVDADGGWHEAGSIGWFATDDATYASLIKFNRELDEYIRYAHEHDLCLTILDCHY